MKTVVFRVAERTTNFASFEEAWKAEVPVHVAAIEGSILGNEVERRSLLRMAEKFAQRVVSPQSFEDQLDRAAAEYVVLAQVALGLSDWQGAWGLLYSDTTRHADGSEAKASVFIPEELEHFAITRRRVGGFKESPTPLRRGRCSIGDDRRPRDRRPAGESGR